VVSINFRQVGDIISSTTLKTAASRHKCRDTKKIAGAYWRFKKQKTPLCIGSQGSLTGEIWR
jgi:hypothetical protein